MFNKTLKTFTVGLLLSLGVNLACQAQWPMPARQVSALTNGWTYIPHSKTNAQLVFNWLDDILGIDTSGWVYLDPATNTPQSVFDFIDDAFSDGFLPGTNIVDVLFTNGQWYISLSFLKGTNIIGATYDPTSKQWTVSAQTAGLMPGTNIIGATYNPSDSNWTINASAVVEDYGYLEGMTPRYMDTDTISFSPGRGYCNSNFFIIPGWTNVDVSQASSRNFYYVYVDDSACAYPTSVAFTSTTTPPTEKPDGTGWYNGADRCVGAFRSKLGASEFVPFVSDGSGRSYRTVVAGSVTNPYTTGFGSLETQIGLNSLVSTNIYRTVANISGNELEAMLPVNVESVSISFHFKSPGGNALFYSVATTEMPGVTVGGASRSAFAHYVYGYADTYAYYDLPFRSNTSEVVFSSQDQAVLNGADFMLEGWRTRR